MMLDRETQYGWLWIVFVRDLEQLLPRLTAIQDAAFQKVIGATGSFGHGSGAGAPQTRFVYPQIVGIGYGLGPDNSYSLEVLVSRDTPEIRQIVESLMFAHDIGPETAIDVISIGSIVPVRGPRSAAILLARITRLARSAVPFPMHSEIHFYSARHMCSTPLMKGRSKGRCGALGHIAVVHSTIALVLLPGPSSCMSIPSPTLTMRDYVLLTIAMMWGLAYGKSGPFEV